MNVENGIALGKFHTLERSLNVLFIHFAFIFVLLILNSMHFNCVENLCFVYVLLMMSMALKEKKKEKKKC